MAPFFGCASLALTSLPDGLTSIGDYAFNGCASLTLTSLPDGLTRIGRGAFNGCASLGPHMSLEQRPANAFCLVF